MDRLDAHELIVDPVELTIESDETGPFLEETLVGSIVRPHLGDEPMRIVLPEPLLVPAGGRLSVSDNGAELINE